MAESKGGPAVVAGLKEDLAKWRTRLAAIGAGQGFDTQGAMISAWIKEGQRLLDRIETDLNA